MDRGHANIGSLIAGRYRVEALIGEGGMAVVYRATHTSTGKVCALKLVRPHMVARPGVADLLIREALVAGKVGEHPNIVNVTDAGMDEVHRVPFIAMELLQGVTLDRFVEESGPVPQNMAAKLLDQLADGLTQAHRVGVIHRDLKPSNLFLTRDRSGEPLLKIMDFGIAKILMNEESSRTATRIGSPVYGAPEQQSGAMIRNLAAAQGITIAQGVSPATDVWAVGLVAYEIITGHINGQYWDAPDTLSDLIMTIALKEPAPASVRAGDRAALLPPGFDGWLAKCLRKNALERWSSVPEAIAALHRIMGLPGSIAARLSNEPLLTQPATESGKYKALNFDDAPDALAPRPSRAPGAAAAAENAPLDTDLIETRVAPNRLAMASGAKVAPAPLSPTLTTTGDWARTAGRPSRSKVALAVSALAVLGGAALFALSWGPAPVAPSNDAGEPVVAVQSPVGAPPEAPSAAPAASNEAPDDANSGAARPSGGGKPYKPAPASGPAPTASAQEKATSPDAAPPAMGELRIRAKGGYCTIRIDGRTYGATPLVQKVRAGNHTVTCGNPQKSIGSQTVSVVAGQPTTVSFTIPK